MFRDMLRVSGTSVTRADALSVPAVRRGRNMLCSIATMPLEQVGPHHVVEPSVLLAQVDTDVANVVTIAQTVEDLVFSGISWWLKTADDPAGFPIAARHLDVTRVSLTPPKNYRNPAPLPSGVDPRGGVVWVDGKPVAGSRVIRFDSPNPAVLAHAGREIRRAILLDKAAGMYAEDPRPSDYFAPADGADTVDDDEVKTILAKWEAARRERATAYVPAALSYNTVDSPNPQELQLAELQKQVSLDIANGLGVDPEDLGISTTSRTYSNDVDRRRNKLNEVLSPYMRAITDRLSMGDVTRPGYRVRFNTTEYLMPNPVDRWSVWSTGHGIGAITLDEIRDEDGRPPLPAADATGGEATGLDAEVARAIAELSQKLYLATEGKVIFTLDEARQLANRAGAGLTGPGPATPAATDAEEAPVPDDPDVAASRPAALTFNRDKFRFEHDPSAGLTFTDIPITEFSVDLAGRTIEGLALPYGKIGAKYGYKYRFDKGALSWSEVSRVKLLREHFQAIGRAISLNDTAAGLKVKFKVARGDAGDEALLLAEDGVLDGMSVGVDFDMAVDTVPDPKNRGVTLIRRADLREVSLTAMPAFDDARVTKVAASRTGDNTMQCTVCGQVHAEGVACTAPAPAAPPDGDPAAAAAANEPAVAVTAAAPAGLTLSQDQLAAVLAVPGAFQAITHQPTPEPTAPVAGLNLSMEQVSQLVGWAQAAAATGAPAPAPAVPAAPEAPAGPTPVNPTRPLDLAVTAEELPYRFDRRGHFTGETDHVFSADLVDAVKRGDFDGTGSDAGKRVMAFIQAKFADVDVADVNDLNEPIQRPDMYVDQRDFRYPIWESIDKGAPPNGVQPFIFPKFNSAAGLVGDHTEGVEPTGGTFTTTSQTVTPTALSGKASLTREIWDTGGNPAVSTLIWAQMQRSWREGLESSAATFLNTLTAAIDITLGVAVIDDALVAAWDTAIADLQFVRGYDFEMFAVERVLYGAFVNASDLDGRKLVPQINPQNASGTASRRFVQLDLAGVTGVPAWALPSTPGSLNNSWLYDPMTVSGWASPPQRLDLLGSGGAAAGPDYKPVAYVDIAIWGYKAFANSDLGGVRQVTYDSVA